MLPKAYDPKAVEDRIYKMWEESGAFIANATSQKEPFTISMPPPNATGQLHLGHAVMLALEDIFIRFARMRGKEALWVPGTDHAAIATESVVIRKIQEEEGIPDPRAKLGREEVIRRIAEYVGKSQGTIRAQIRKMGASCDWSRECYTFEPALNRCVNEVFKKMFEDGLIYRGHRIVNWDPKLKTTVSDDEIDYREERSPFYTFQYGPFQISTARPETKFGDKEVVMHPDDERYAAYAHGENFECEWINGRITATIIKDKAVNPEFGTGVMTITPWHDHADFEIAERHNLEKVQIIGFDGRLLPIAGEFAGMTIEEARPKIVEKLKRKGLLVSVDEQYEHRVAVSYRGGGIVEPQIKEQWFIDVHKRAVMWREKKMSLKEIMQDVVRSKSIKIIPERFEKVYFHWIDNLRDWCISRQIWWGHRVPVYYCHTCGAGESASESKSPRRQDSKIPNSKIIVSVKPLEKCPTCGADVKQDPDTLDTWFSSALWTWSTLVEKKFTTDFSLSLPELLKRSPDFRKFHPTQVMETGYDILFFWVARMILMTTYATGQIPFETVYLHGLIRTRDGRKMSKSDPETMIDPLDIIPKYGADALRLSMIVGQSPGNDARLYEEKIAGYRNFVNKLWNASRFVLMECERGGVEPSNCKMEDTTRGEENLSLADRALLSELQKLIYDVTDGLESYRLSEVGERLYSFTWDFFCDWYLELSKGNANHVVLIHTLRTLLILLHPYIPFVTEELWSQVKHMDDDMLLNTPWPTVDPSLKDDDAASQLKVLIDVITAIRSIRTDYAVESGKKIDVVLVTQEIADLLREQQEHVKRLVKVGTLTIQGEPYEKKGSASLFTKHVEVHVPLEGLVDATKERERLSKERSELERFLASVQAKLQNEQFMKNAREEVIAKERQKERDTVEKLEKVREKLASLR